VLGITNNNGVNVIVDSIGANYFKQNLTALAVDGRLVMLALQSGSKVDQLNLSQIISKRLTIVGSTLRNRHIDYKKKLVSEFSRIYFPFFETGTLAPVVDSTFDWQQADNALTLLGSNTTIGKIILTGM
jgi:NADPH:quinone reductase-like Zn-dependent oxidoreductase